MQLTRRAARHAARATLFPRVPQDDQDHGKPTPVHRTAAASHSDDTDDEDDDRDKTTTGTKRKKKAKTTATSGSSGDVMFLGWATANTPKVDAALASTGTLSIVQAVATGTAIAGATPQMPAHPQQSSTPPGGLGDVALYSIIGGAALFGLIVLSSLIICVLRRRRARAEASWPAYAPSGAFRTSMAEDGLPGPGKGPGARGEKLRDDASLAGTIEKQNPFSTAASTPLDEKAPYDLHPSTPRLGQQDNLQLEQLTPSHPDYKPPRPPRPSEQYSFSSSPIKTVTHKVALSGHARNQSRAAGPTQPQQGLDTYQRNLLALTTSMSFDGPPQHVRNRTATAGSPADADPYETSPFDDPAAAPYVQRKPSRKLDNKKDTLIGFAESYGDADDEGDISRQTMPLTIRGHANLSRSTSITRTPDMAPTLSMVDMPVSAAESMRDLESVLDSFGFDNRPESMAPMPALPEPVAQLSLGNRAPNRGLLVPVPAIAAIEAAGAGNAKSGYRVTRPGAGIGVSIVSNVSSIHSTMGVFGDATPATATENSSGKLPASATSPNLAALARSGSVSKAGMTRSETSPSLAGRRQSTVSLAAPGVAARRSQPALPRAAGTQADVLLPSSASNKRISTLTNSTYPDDDGDELRASGSHFGLEEDAKLARALSLSRRSRVQEPSEPTVAAQRTRQRSNSVAGQKLATASRGVARSRTSTAYGGQMPPTPALGDLTAPTPTERQLRHLTTDSEAVFAVGSSMLAAYPDTPDDFLRSPQVMQMLQSPDLLIHPPSPSIGSAASRRHSVVRETERQYQDRLAADGFVPLAQMALGANDHDRNYRSQIDSIVGVFDYEDQHKH